MNLRVIFLICVFNLTFSSALPTIEDGDPGNKDVDKKIVESTPSETKIRSHVERSLIEVGNNHPTAHTGTGIHPPGHDGGITNQITPSGDVIHHLGDNGAPSRNGIGHVVHTGAHIAGNTGHVIDPAHGLHHPPVSGASTGPPNTGTPVKPPPHPHEEKGFWDELKDTFGDNLPFAILCAILILIIIIIVCCSVLLINMINKKPSIATVNEEFEKWREQEQNNQVAVETTDGIKLESYPHRPRSLIRPQVTFQNVPEEHVSYTQSYSTLTTPPESVSDDRLKQIEKEIRELEASMRNPSLGIGTSDSLSYPKELETLAGRPDQLRDLDHLTSNPDQIKDLQSIIRKPDELKSVDKLTNKPDELRNLGHIVGRDNSQQLKDIHMIVQHPVQLNQMTALVQMPEQLDAIHKLANRDLSQLEHYPTVQEKPHDFARGGAEPIYERQMSEKSAAIAKLDSILEGFSEMEKPEPEKPVAEVENVVPTNITQEARKQAKLPSGIDPPSRGAVAVLPVPGFKRSSRERLEEQPPRTKPTISLYSTKTTTPRPQFPATTRSLPRNVDIPEPRQSIAFGSRTSPTVPQPLKARTGRTSSGGHRNMIYGSRADYQGSDPDLAFRQFRKTQFNAEQEGQGDTTSSLDEYPVHSNVN